MKSEQIVAVGAVSLFLHWHTWDKQTTSSSTPVSKKSFPLYHNIIAQLKLLHSLNLTVAMLIGSKMHILNTPETLRIKEPNTGVLPFICKLHV